MPSTRRRRIVRRAVMTLAGCVLLPGAYLFSMMTLWFAFGAGWIPRNAISHPVMVTVVRPMVWYAWESGYPGGKSIVDLLQLCDDTGRRLVQRD
jgi:hypothetical protein